MCCSAYIAVVKEGAKHRVRVVVVVMADGRLGHHGLHIQHLMEREKGAGIMRVKPLAQVHAGVRLALIVLSAEPLAASRPR